jgi:hypothetical protein
LTPYGRQRPDAARQEPAAAQPPSPMRQARAASTFRPSETTAPTR